MPKDYLVTALLRIGMCGALLFVAACTRPPDKWERARIRTFPATGRVLLDGQPVSEASVIFQNDGVPTSPSALTSKEGVFYLRTYVPKDGAPAGTYAVAVSKTTESRPPNDPELPPPPLEITHHLPWRYRSPKTSGLTAEVTEAGPNEFVFELSTK